MPAFTPKDLAAVVVALREEGFEISEHEASSAERLAMAIRMTPPKPLKQIQPLNRRTINMSDTRPDITPQACHEAAHLCIGHRFGMRAKRAAVGNRRGMAVFHNTSPLELSRDASYRRAELDDRIHAEAIVALAGAEAEHAILGTALGNEDDLVKVVMAADRLKIAEHDQDEVIRIWTQTAREMVAKETDTIIALAEALDQRSVLSGGEIRAIIRNGSDDDE